MTATVYASGCIEIPLTGLVATTGGGIASVANPEGVPLIITDVKTYVDVISTGAANYSAGIAANGTTSATNLINALSAQSTALTAYHGMTALAAKGAAVVWGTTEYLTVTGSADSSGFEGRLWVHYVRTA